MLDPQSMSPGSIMPPYPWLIDDEIDYSDLPKKIRVMQQLGVPYEEGFDQVAVEHAKKQAEGIAASLERDKIKTDKDKEIIALIAYLQKLGIDIKQK